MGRTNEKVNVKNVVDLFGVASGALDQSNVRSADLLALVDTGAAYLCISPAIIQQLGLLYSHSTSVKTANGAVMRRIFNGAKITIRERDVTMDVMENDETTPNLIGYLVLQALDFVVDLKHESLMPNPEHDGKWIIDLY